MTLADFDAMFALWRAGDEDAAVEYFTPDGVFWEAKREPLVGRATIAASWKPFFHGGPEWRMDVSEIFEDAGRFAISYLWEVKTSDGTWVGSPGCAIVHTRDGKIAEWREYKA